MILYAKLFEFFQVLVKPFSIFIDGAFVSEAIHQRQGSNVRGAEETIIALSVAVPFEQADATQSFTCTNVQLLSQLGLVQIVVSAFLDHRLTQTVKRGFRNIIVPALRLFKLAQILLRR